MNNKSYSSNLGSGIQVFISAIYAIPDNSGYYIVGPPGTSYKICRYLHGQSSIKCQTIPSISSFILSILRISSDRFFLTGWNSGDGFYCTMTDLTFGSSQINWGVSMKRLSNYSYCPLFNGAALSSDKSKIYVLLPFGKVSITSNSTNTTYAYDLNLYFVTLSAATGSVVGSIYLTDNGGYSVHGAAMSGDYVVAPFNSLFSFGSTFLMFYNTATSTFSFKAFSGNLYFPNYHQIADK